MSVPTDGQSYKVTGDVDLLLVDSRLQLSSLLLLLLREGGGREGEGGGRGEEEGEGESSLCYIFSYSTIENLFFSFKNCHINMYSYTSIIV